MLFEPYRLGPIALANRLVMAPMTRSRATTDHTPTPIMAEYYAARAAMGLIITEGTSPAPEGLGYARIPGLYSDEQVSAWRHVTDAVHAAGGHIFAQLMHVGRVAHLQNLPEGVAVVGATSEAAPGMMYTDADGPQPHSAPHALTIPEIADAVAGYAHSASRAIEAGFDGVELHAANGYLIEQFLNANVNTRSDAYGGSASARNRFALEVAKATIAAVGAERVGIRVSPYGVFNGTGPYDDVEAQYLSLAHELHALGLVYLHLVDHSSMGAPTVPVSFKQALRATFSGTFIGSGGLDQESAEAMLEAKDADLVAFGRASLANPDLVQRFQTSAALNEPDPSTFYTPGPAGYTDYPVLSETEHTTQAHA